MGVNGIYGLSGSGLDIESMVKVGMMGKQNEYDKMAQKYTKNEWTKAAYLELSSSISTFNASKLSDYKMSASMNARTADSTSSAVKVSANATAAVMSHRVQVTELASSAYLVGKPNTIERKTNDSTKQDSIYLADALFKSITTTDGGETFTVAFETDDLTGDISGTFGKGDVAMSFLLLDGTKDIADLTTEEKAKYTISFTYGELYGEDGNGVTFNTLASKINSSGLNIKAAYDSVNDSFSLYNTKGGKNNTISFTLDQVTATKPVQATDAEGNPVTDENGDPVMTTTPDYDYATYVNGGNTEDNLKSLAALTTRDFLNNLNLKKSANETLTEVSFTTGETTAITGDSGTIKVDGVEYKTDDNKVTVGGITYNAIDTTSETAVVTVSQDVDAIVDKVKSFVEDYNKLLASLYEKYDEKPDSNYKPLTQSQKDGMKEEQITKWEEKAKAGILYHDRTLSKIILDMRSAISSSIDLGNGETTSAYNIGISTTGLKGQLTLDEDKLRAALAEDSDAVYNVFAKLDVKQMDNKATSGIAQRLGDVFTTAIKNIKSRAGSSSDVTEDSDLNNLLRNLQTKMSNFKKLMNSFEDALYKKYDKMESALAKLGTQMNYILGSSSQ